MSHTLTGTPEVSFLNNLVRCATAFDHNLVGVAALIDPSHVWFNGNVYSETIADQLPYGAQDDEVDITDWRSGTYGYVGPDEDEEDVSRNFVYAPSTSLLRARIIGVYHDFWGDVRDATATNAGAVD